VALGRTWNCSASDGASGPLTVLQARGYTATARAPGRDESRRSSLQAPAGQRVPRTLSVAVRATQRLDAHVHGRIADSVGATGSVKRHLPSSGLRDGVGSSGL